MKLRPLSPLLLAAAVAVPAVVGSSAVPAFAQTPAPAPATQPSENEGRSLQEIMTEIQQAGQSLAPVMSDPAVLTDPQARDAAADEAIPVFRRMVQLMEEAANAAPMPQMAQEMRAGQYQLRGLLVGFGDEQAQQTLEAEDSVEADAALVLGNYIAADEKQGRLQAVERLSTLAEQNPQHQAVAQTAMGLFGLAQDDEVRNAVRDVITGKLEGPAAQQMQQMLQQMEQAQQGQQAFKDRFIGKPLTIEGQTLQGESFSTQQWKGKVVLVDFWATWCGPCIAALPKVKEDYAKYHDQGLEIVGVSLDQSADPLKAFLAENPEMSWTQLFTEGNPQATQQIAENLGITAIPTVFLLDRDGIVRGMAVGGGAEMDRLHQMIPQLIKQEAGQAPATQPAQ